MKSHSIRPNRRPRPVVAAALLVSLAASSILSLPARAAPRGAVTVISGATIVDGTGRPPLADGAVIVKGNRIAWVGPRADARIPAGARVLDAAGRFVIPGLCDAHMHLDVDGYGITDAKADYAASLSRMLAWGFTTVFDPGSRDFSAFAALKRLGADDSSPHARYFGTGYGIGAVGGYGPKTARRPATPAEARAVVRELKASGVDAVKVYQSDMIYVTKALRPVLDDELLAAIVGEAHRLGLKVFVHAPVLEHAKSALRAGADGLLHGILSGPVDDELLALMKRNRAVYVPTFAVFDSIAGLNDWARRAASLDGERKIPDRIYAAAARPEIQTAWEAKWDNLAYMKERLPVLRANLIRVWSSGVPVVAGSDLAGALMGVSSQLELVTMADAGMPPGDVIRSATLEAARMLGRERDLGSVERGKLADLVVLDADPIRDVRNVRRVAYVLKGGQVYEPAWLLGKERRR